MKSNKLVGAVVAVLAALWAGSAWATDVYVAENGEDAAGRGGEQAPYKTLPYALEAMGSSEGTIHLAAGTFVVNTNLNLTAAVKVVGAGVGKTFVTREGTDYRRYKLFILTNAGAAVTDLTVQDVYAWDVGGISGAIFEFPNTTGAGSLARLEVTGCTAGSSGSGYVCFIGSKTSVTVEDVVFRNNTMRPSGGSGVIYANSATSAKITGCAFIGNRDFSSGALRVGGACEVVSCTFADNRTNFTVPASARGGAVYIENEWNSAMSFSNCVFFSDHAWYDAAEMAPELNVASKNVAARFRNCAWDSRVKAIGSGAIAITESAFTDVYSGDYRPHAKSPLVTADGVIGALGASTATGPAYTPTGAAEITLAENASINDAIQAAPDGQVINLSAGIYSVTGTLWIAKHLTLKGAGRDKTFLMREGTTYNSEPYLRLEHPQAVVRDVTISNVTAKANNQAGALFITARGGWFENARIAKCSGAGSGSGAVVGLAGGTNSVITHCYVNDNQCYGSSGNSTLYLWGGILDTSLVCKNTSITLGCISLRGPGKVTNCTVADNTCKNNDSKFVCAGIYWHNGDNYNPCSARVINTIVTRGTAEKDTSTGAPDWYKYGGTAAQMAVCFSNCAWSVSTPVNADTDVQVADDGFVDAPNQDYHLKTTSAAYESGRTYEGMSTTDLDGVERPQGDNVDIGCFEKSVAGFSVEIKVVPTSGFVGEKFHCTPVITGLKSGKAYTCRWTFKNETKSEADLVVDQVEYDQVFTSAGVRSVSLEVFDGDGKSLGTATPQLNYLNVGVTDCYVADASDGSVTPEFPYATPGTAAKKSIGEMVAAAVPGQRIHALAGRINVGGAVDLSGLQLTGLGWDKTVLTNGMYYPYGQGYDATPYPFITLNSADALMSDLCVSNVETYSNGPSVLSVGALGGTVERVKIAKCRGGNASNGYIVGLYATNAVMRNCWVSDCTVQPNGSCGGIYVEKGFVDNTLVDKINALMTGGGIIAAGFGAWFRNVTVVRCNKSGNTWSNDAFAGIVFYDSHNPQTQCGHFINCVSAENETSSKAGIGGSAWRGCETRQECFANSVSNCAFSADAQVVGVDCCSVAAADFKDAVRGVWRPRTTSPMSGRGKYEAWMASATDVAGKPRVTESHKVDIGAFQANHAGLMLILK